MISRAPWWAAALLISCTSEAPHARAVEVDGGFDGGAIEASADLARTLAGMGFSTLDDQTTCPRPSLFDRRFASYDDVGAPTPSLESELLALPGARVIGSSIEGRTIVAVYFGPAPSPSPTTPKVPTVYVLATYHAREWVGEEVAMRLVRWADRASRGARSPYSEYAIDAAISSALSRAALVIVPVVNPDGYQFTRTPGHDRNWRKNRRQGTCVVGRSGVDLNRNHSAFWDLGGEPSDPASPTDPSDPSDGCSDVYRGSAPASEPEVRAIEVLLEGGSFEPARAPVVTLSYHSAADVVVFPDGVRTDPGGPRCDLSSRCFDADDLVFRALFRDDEHPLLHDDSTPKKRAYAIGEAASVLAPNAGNSAMQGLYGPSPHLSVTIEMTGANVGFDLECQDDPESILSPLVAQQQALLRSLLERAPSIADDDFAKKTLGVIGPGVFVREASDGIDPASARPRFVQGELRGEVAPLTLRIDARPPMPMHDARTAAHYHAFYLDAAETNEARNPLVLPCKLTTAAGASSVVTSSDCTGSIDLCDPKRLPASGFRLHDETRGGARDCWWEPSSDDEATLTIPSMPTAPLDGSTPPTHCYLSFSVEWAMHDGARPVILESLDDVGVYHDVTQWPFARPLGELRFGAPRLRNEIVDLSRGIASGRTASLRFRAPKVTDGSTSGFSLFDPVVYCRTGALP